MKVLFIVTGCYGEGGGGAGFVVLQTQVPVVAGLHILAATSSQDRPHWILLLSSCDVGAPWVCSVELYELRLWVLSYASGLE